MGQLYMSNVPSLVAIVLEDNKYLTSPETPLKIVRFPCCGQAVDARKAAVDEVERLLQHPEDIKRLPNMLEEYTQKQQANKTQLSATVASQVDAARAGMELLDSAQKTLAKMQECYRVRPLPQSSRSLSLLHAFTCGCLWIYLIVMIIIMIEMVLCTSTTTLTCPACNALVTIRDGCTYSSA